MKKYRVNWNYSSSYGSFSKDDVIELEDEKAESINRDSPGVLSAIENHSHDRMVKAASKRGKDETK